MGLLLSVLVTCIGVVELLTFYENVKRRVVYPRPLESSLKPVRDRYLQELEGVRDRLAGQLEDLQQQTSKIPTVRLNSHEDIEIEFNEKALVKSRSPSPRRFLVEEKGASDANRRHFVVSEEPQSLQSLKKSRAEECVPEYLVEEEKRSDVPRYVLKNGDGPVPLPLPSKFAVTERESRHDVFRRKSGHTLVEVDGELYFRRSPSPFPSFELTAPRNSVCSELIEESASVAEVDERSRSTSPAELTKGPEKFDVILNSGAAAHSSSTYWENKALLVPEKRSKSRSPSPRAKKALAVAEALKVNKLEDEQDEEFMEVQPYTEEMKNSLDGVDKTKGCVKKKYVKRKQVKNQAASTNKLDSAQTSDDSRQPRTNLDEKSIGVETLPNKANEKSSGANTGEPFWVNH